MPDGELFIERGKPFAVSSAVDGVRLTHRATGSVLIIPSGVEATIPLTGMWTVADGPPREKPVAVTVSGLDARSATVTRVPLAMVEQLAAAGQVPTAWLAGARRAEAARFRRG